MLQRARYELCCTTNSLHLLTSRAVIQTFDAWTVFNFSFIFHQTEYIFTKPPVKVKLNTTHATRDGSAMTTISSQQREVIVT